MAVRWEVGEERNVRGKKARERARARGGEGVGVGRLEAEGDKGTVCKGKVRWRMRGRKEGKKVGWRREKH